MQNLGIILINQGYYPKELMKKILLLNTLLFPLIGAAQLQTVF